MSRAVLVGMVALWLLCLLLLGGGVVIGKTLLTEPGAVFLTFKSNVAFLITWMDTQLHLQHQSQIINAVLPAGIDNDCRLLFPMVVGNRVNLVYLNLKTGKMRTYLPGYSSLNDARWLPDDRHLWVRVRDARHMTRHLILDTDSGEHVDLAIPHSEFIPSGYAIWSPDSRYGLVYLHAIGMTTFVGMVWTETGETYPIPVNPGIIAAAWSSDSRWLAAQNSSLSRVVLLDAYGKSYQQQQFRDVPNNIPPLWLADGSLLLLARQSGSPPGFTGYRWSPADNTLEAAALWLPQKASGGEGMGGWSPDKSLLYYNLEAVTRIYDVATGEIRMQFNALVYDALWSPDSRYLVEYEIGTGTLIIADTASGNVARFPGFKANPVVQWSPDNRELSLYDRANTTVGRIRFDDSGMVLDMGLPLKNTYSGALCYGD